MLKRRDFLKHSLVVSAAGPTLLTPTAASLASAPAASGCAIRFVIFDEQLEDSVAFADTLAGKGVEAFSTRDDIGRLWFGELGRKFKAGDAVAGLTSHSELLVSCEFARQAGARIRFEGAHDCRGRDVLTHSLRMNSATPPLGPALLDARMQWPRVLALHAGKFATNVDPLRAETWNTDTPRSATHPGSLFSWVLA